MSEPKSQMIIHDREELFQLLCEAAEFEHTVMATYLYAGWSLKRAPDPGCTAAELVAVDRWRGTLRRVALEEMLHLTLVNNLLAAVGAAPHLGRPEFPVAPGRFPADSVFSLRPFCAASMAHFVFIERPEGVEVADGAGFHRTLQYARVCRPDFLNPTPQDYASQGQLYHGIAMALQEAVERFGEDAVFVGHGESQVGGAEFRLPGLFKVTDLASALRALEEIVVQGEGAPAHSEDSHYGLFRKVHEEFLEMKAARPEFEPAHLCVPDPVVNDPLGQAEDRLIRDPLSARVVDLGDALYGVMMRSFAQVFSPSPLPQPLRTGLANVATELMYALSSAAELAARLPAGIDNGEHAGKTAGLSLQLPLANNQLVQSCAAQILAERVSEICTAARRLSAEVELVDVAERLDRLSAQLRNLHERYEGHIASLVDRLATSVAPPSNSELTSAAADGDDPNVARTDDLTLRFDTTRCIHSRRCVLSAPKVFLANVEGAWLHPEASTVENLVQIAHACPSGAITYQRRDGGPSEPGRDVNVVRVRENGPYGVRANLEIEGHPEPLLRATLCRCGKSKNKPFCDNSHRDAEFVATGEPTTLPSDALDARGGVLNVEPLHNGPLQVTENIEICAGTGRTVDRIQSCRLCRCGGSKTKPYCDGTHARIRFRSDS
ncbi:MAG: CDGSH iron-sulfur domain-containing protein [Nannocystaceae bacterium]|nr:CDGSH iron-sulfur domain-containing protein [Nannocystaceae bacterium]